MNEFEKEVAIRKVVSDETKRLRSEKKDRYLFITCASCLFLIAVLPKGIHNLPLLVLALSSWLVYIEFLEIPKSWSEDSDLRWHVFRTHKIIENSFQKDKGWKTLILLIGFFALRIILKMK